MEYAEKMYLVPQHQLEKLKNENVRESIQQVVENDLDASIRNILLRSDLTQYEKAKLYSNILNRFLTIVKQGDRENNILTLSLPYSEHDHKDEQPITTPKDDSGRFDKKVTAPQKVWDDRRPLEWSEFIQAFAELNIPFYTVPNHNVRWAINSLKRPDTATPEYESPSKKVKISDIVTAESKSFSFVTEVGCFRRSCV